MDAFFKRRFRQLATLFAVAFNVLAVAGAGAQPAKIRNSESDAFAEEPAWVKPALDQVEAILGKSRVTFPPSPARVEALSVLDGPLHLEYANRFRSVHEFLLRRLTATVAEIEATRVTTGAMIWKLYNHGFVVRTASVTLGFDVVRGWQPPGAPAFGLTPELTLRLARQLDVLAVSHFHGDHADSYVMRVALAAGVVVLADESVFGDAVPHPLLIRPPRLDQFAAIDRATSPRLADVVTSRGEVVKYMAYPGHQAPDTTNNVFLLRTPEGLSFMHTGDQDWNDDGWMDNVALQHRVDVMLVNCWSSNLGRLVLGVKPELVVMGHENEMNHTPDHREAFWRSFQCFRPLESQPYYVLCWGEGGPYPIEGRVPALISK